MSLRRTSRYLTAGTTALLLAAGAVGCSDTSDAASTGTQPTAAPTTLDPAACDAYGTLSASLMGDPSAAEPAGKALLAAVPATLRDPATAYVGAFEAAGKGDEAAMSSPEFAGAAKTVGDAVFEDCDAINHLDVHGADYSFTGVPNQIRAGRTAIRFTNDTKTGEAHEIMLAQRAEGTNDSVADLVKLPPDELMGKVTPIAVVFAEQAGGAATALIDLQPGRYLAICNIPLGGAETGDPHSVHGMVTELTVA